MTITIAPPVSAGPGTTAAKILDLGGGTRAAALGDAFSAINNDVTAALWNPSGLGIMENRQAAISYVDRTQLFGEAGEGLYYAFFAGAMPLGDAGTLGTMLQLEGQGTIDVTIDSPEPIRKESLGTNWVWTASYADKLAQGLFGGISGKIISLKLGGGRRTGVCHRSRCAIRPTLNIVTVSDSGWCGSTELGNTDTFHR